MVLIQPPSRLQVQHFCRLPVHLITPLPKPAFIHCILTLTVLANECLSLSRQAPIGPIKAVLVNAHSKNPLSVNFD
jgi:hypothetical protein